MKLAAVARVDAVGNSKCAEVEGIDYDSETSALDVTPKNKKKKGKHQNSESKKMEATKKVAKVKAKSKNVVKKNVPKMSRKGRKPKRYDGLQVDEVKTLYANVSQKNTKYIAEYIRNGIYYLPVKDIIASYADRVSKCSPNEFYTKETFVGNLSHVKDELLYNSAARFGLNQMVQSGIGVIDFLTSSGLDLFCNTDGVGITKYIQLLMCK